VFSLVILCVVSIFGVLSVFPFFGKANDVTCILRYWLVFIFAMLQSGGLVVKQFRIYRVFSNRNFQHTVITNTHLTLMIFLLLVPVLVILIIWTALGELGARLDSSNEHLICDSDDYYIYIFVLVGYEAFWLIISSFLAILTRNFGDYADAKLIGFGLYNSTIVSLIMIPIIFGLESSHFIQWLIGVLFVLLYFFSTFVIIIVPKIYAVLVKDRNLTKAQRTELPATVHEKKASSFTGTNNSS